LERFKEILLKYENVKIYGYHEKDPVCMTTLLMMEKVSSGDQVTLNLERKSIPCRLNIVPCPSPLS
jgi:hypothetical protein